MTDLSNLLPTPLDEIRGRDVVTEIVPIEAFTTITLDGVTGTIPVLGMTYTMGNGETRKTVYFPPDLAIYQINLYSLWLDRLEAAHAPATEQDINA